MSESIIGRPVPRVDGGEKVAGLTRFAADVAPAGAAHARLVLSPHPHARAARIDTAAARALPGVVGVFTGRDLPLAKPDSGSRNRAPRRAATSPAGTWRRRLQSATLMDYALPKIEQVPEGVEIIPEEVPSEHGPFGARGVGEPPVVAGGAVIASALAAATGHRFTALPITSEAIAAAAREPATAARRAA